MIEDRDKRRTKGKDQGKAFDGGNSPDKGLCADDTARRLRLAKTIVSKLRENGFEAYFVGGCVRDMLLGRKITEIDIATSARPEQIMAIFRRTRSVGAKFGVVLVGLGPFWFEVATFRRDIGYEDGRHPTAIEAGSIHDDAVRRDFTINGLYYDPESGQIIDLIGGREDIERRIIRAIGNPIERFREDYLRMLRAIRFYAELYEFGFKIDKDTEDAIRRLSSRLKDTSIERITEEVKRLLAAPGRAKAVELMYELGLFGVIFPDLEKLIKEDAENIVLKRGVCTLERLKSPDWQLAIAVLILSGTLSYGSFSLRKDGPSGDERVLQLCRTGEALKDGCDDILGKLLCSRFITYRLPPEKKLSSRGRLALAVGRYLRLSNKQIHKITWIVEYLPLLLCEDLGLADIKQMIIIGFFDEMLKVLEAFVEGGLIERSVLERIDSLLARIDRSSLPPPCLITGEDLKREFKLPCGPIYKKVLAALFRAQLDDRIKTRKEALLLAQRLIERLRSSSS